MNAKHLTICITLGLTTLTASAQHTGIEPQLDMENGVVSISDNRAFTIRSHDGRFTFKPYLLVNTAFEANYYDDEGLDKAYNQDNVAHSGFAINHAVLGFTGRAFGRLDYNLCVNAAASGQALLQQAWIDYTVRPSLRFRAGKFKTPFSHAYLTALGETLMPSLPTSLTAAVILPHSLNAVNPAFGTGFDLGVEVHGLIRERWGYEIGLFNGTGINVNTATKTLSDDYHIPSLLYAGRLTFQPKGPMPNTQGNPQLLRTNKLLIGISASYNVESENESINDFRAGLEFAWLKNHLYVAGEMYYMNMQFTRRQKISEKFDFLGGYVQAGYFVTSRLQPALRYDFMNRNGTDTKGFLNMPAVGCNYFFPGCGLKLQAMYQFTGRVKHETQLDRDNDDLGLSTHKGVLTLQYSF